MRKIFFWFHFGAGLAASLLFLFMACSGMLIAFAPQITAWAERGPSRAASSADAPGLPPSALATRASEALPGGPLGTLTFKRDPAAAVFASAAKGGKGIWLDPATGAVLGTSSRARAWLTDVEHWHRWMGESKRGKQLTHASTLFLLFLVPTGWLLWIPRGRAAWKRAFVPNLRLMSYAGYRNLHTTIGFWSGAGLVVIGLTGIIMAYPWAERGLYALAGEKAPARRAESAGPRPGRKPSASAPSWNPASLDSLWVDAHRKAPDWNAITLRPPLETGKPVMAQIEEKGFLSFPRRSRLSADAATGASGKFEAWSALTQGQRWRAAITPLHTGRGFGWAGQTAAGMAAFCLTLVSWTGILLGIKRWKGQNSLNPHKFGLRNKLRRHSDSSNLD